MGLHAICGAGLHFESRSGGGVSGDTVTASGRCVADFDFSPSLSAGLSGTGGRLFGPPDGDGPGVTPGGNSIPKTGSAPPKIKPCGESTLDTIIGAASAVGSFAQDVGDVGQIIGGGVAFINPVLGGAIFTGSKVISGVGTGLEVGAALGDAYLNGNTGGLANVGGSAVGGLLGGAAFNRLRNLEFGGQVGRNTLGQFTRHPANKYAKEIERTGNLVGSKYVGLAVCR